MVWYCIRQGNDELVSLDHALETGSCHEVNFVVARAIGGCRYDDKFGTMTNSDFQRVPAVSSQKTLDNSPWGVS